MHDTFCQSCGMPITEEGLFATEADGSKSGDYCKYCYEKGAFTFQGSLEEMISICVTPMVASNPGMTAGQAEAMMQKFLPTLKRWKQQ